MSKLRFTFSLIDNKKMLALNKKHRGLDHTTDVLSFEIAENSPDGTILMGDIVVNRDRAEKQAKELGHSTEEEIAFLVAHGALHLLGVHHEGDGKKLKSQKSKVTLPAASCGAFVIPAPQHAG